MMETGEKIRDRALDRLGLMRDESNLAGQIIDGRWRLVARIGHGAFGQVYEARDASGQRVALKIFNNAFLKSGYLQELGLMFDEDHPNIVKVLSFGYTSGRKYIVYEYVAGGSLRDFIIKERRVKPLEAIELVIEIARALAFAHGRNVVHRDLKPENILLASPRRPFSIKLCDFGLSARFSDGERLNSSFGSPAYMAPEQFEGDYDWRVDFYAVGVILYEMLFGRRPYTGDATSIAYAQKHHAITFPAHSPAGLNGVLDRMLAHAPEDRFQGAEELLEELEACRARLTEERAPGEPLRAPARSQISLKQRWVASLPRAPRAFGASATGELVFYASRRLIMADTEGQFLELMRPGERVEAFALGEGAEGQLVWRSRGAVHVLEGDELTAWPLREELKRTTCQLIASPTGEHLALKTPHHVYLYTIDGELLWRAEIETYGALPPVCFSSDGEVLWLATEAPRTQLLALGLDGALRCRAASPGNDVDLCGASGGRVLVGTRGNTRLCLVALDGFIEHETTLTEQMLSLQRVGEHAAVMSDGHIELFDLEQLETRALVKIPSLQDMALLTCDGLYQVGQTGDEFRIHYYAFAR